MTFLPKLVGQWSTTDPYLKKTNCFLNDSNFKGPLRGIEPHKLFYKIKKKTPAPFSFSTPKGQGFPFNMHVYSAPFPRKKHTGGLP